MSDVGGGEVPPSFEDIDSAREIREHEARKPRHRVITDETHSAEREALAALGPFLDALVCVAMRVPSDDRSVMLRAHDALREKLRAFDSTSPKATSE